MPLSPDQLWPTVRRQSHLALANGALVPLATSVTVLEAQGLRFSVRQLERLAQKAAAAPSADNPNDPLAPPYEPDLHIGEVTDSHVALLNKFNVLEEHLLVVTRDYEPQTHLLNEADLRAMLRALAGIDGLAFYNGGTEAGASQPHKHLQVVPLPLADALPQLPFVHCFERATKGGAPAQSGELPFAHAVAPMPPDWWQAPDRAAAPVTGLYHRLWEQLGYPLATSEQPIPYNLLATHDWLWLIPRSREQYQGIAVNALGFAGALLVRDAAMFRQLEATGPLRLLAEVTPNSDTSTEPPDAQRWHQ